MRLSAERSIIWLMSFLTVITTSTLLGYQINITILEICIVFLSLILIIINGKTTIGSIMYYIYLCIIVTCIQYMIYPENIKKWVRIPILILSYSLSFGAMKASWKEILAIFYKTIFLIVLVSTAMYIVVEIIGISIPNKTITIEFLPDYKSYLGIYYNRPDLKRENLGLFTISRNMGIFTEPGLYAVFLLFAIYILLFYKKKRSKTEFLILSFALFTTVSSTGFIVYLMLVAYYIIQSKMFSGVLLKCIVGTILLLMVCIIANDLLNQKQVNHAFSFGSRTYDIIGGINLFIQKPIFGWGYRNVEAYYEIQEGILFVDHPNTNGIVSILYQLGLAGCLVYIIPIRKIIQHTKVAGQEEYNKARFGILIYCLIIMSQPIQYEAINCALMGFALSQNIWEICTYKEEILCVR